MQEMGIQPDILVCRSPMMLDEPTCKKIAQFTNVDIDAVFSSPHLDTTIYQVPIIFYEQKLDQVLLRKMGVESRHADMHTWHSVMESFSARKGKLQIGVTGKYVETHDTYTSLYEALFHASLECGVEIEFAKIDPSALEDTNDICNVLNNVDGLVIPGGFGQRGINGMIKAVTWVRENKIPFLGVSLGLQLMVIDWARNVLNWSDADSTEFNPGTKHPVVNLLDEQSNYSGTMRLGADDIFIEEGTHILAAYGKKQIRERHRHRYEFSNQYREDMKSSGLVLAAFASSGSLVECVEWPHSDHPWGVGVQFHPEYKSKPMSASPLFRDFIAAVKKRGLCDSPG
jgi:CTP synthase